MSSRSGNARTPGFFRRICRFSRFDPFCDPPRVAHGPRIDPFARVAVLASSLACGAVACGGGGGLARPVASLSTSGEAAAAFAPIRAAWSTQTIAGRKQLRPAVERFLVRFPSDGEIPLARAYYVFVLLDDGELAKADFFLRALEMTTPPGATRDLVTIGRAKHLRLQKQAAQAFDLLRPLVGKIVEPAARALLQEEVSLAAIEAHRDYEAIAYMDAWVRNASEEDRDAVRAKVVDALTQLPASVLEGSLRAMRARGAASGYGREIQRLVSERLAKIAIERGDPDLARWLVNPEGGVPSLLGDQEGVLGELATNNRGTSRVDGRMIGLLLPTGSNDLRDEAADVMRGVAWALELPRRDPSAADATKLSTRDDGGDPDRMATTMAELAGEGAAVIIAALDPRAADRAVKWGEDHGMPVLVLAHPPAEKPRDYAFVLGESRSNELLVLGSALSGRGASKIAPVVAAGGDALLGTLGSGGLTLLPPIACDVDPSHAGESRFPIAAWRGEHVRAWLVDGPTECARDLIRELATGTASGIVALTLDAAGTSARADGLRLISASTGEIPVIATRPEDVSDADLRRYFAHEETRPSWWTALGRDAGILARRAVASLPLDATTDAFEIAKRRAATKTAIGTLNVHLWTADTEGMRGAHSLVRNLQAVELPSAEAPRRAPKPSVKTAPK